MPLGMEVGIGPGHIVLDEDPAPPSEKSGPGDFVLDGVAARSLKVAQSSSFQPISIVAKRLDG